MGESQHTPGPWVVGPKLHGFDFSIFNPKGDAESGNWLVAGVRWEANARLIAAAPESHFANKVSVTVLSALLHTELHPNMRKDVEFALEANRAAIAKVEGQAA